MVLVDYRKGSVELAPLIRKFGVPTEVMHLEFADFAFDGDGPKGNMPIAIERKTLHDMLQCIDDGRYAAKQRPGMAKLYQGGILYLLLEGEWMVNNASGLLLEAHGGKWHYCKPSGRTVMYSKLYRYLLSVENAGVRIIHARNMMDSAYNICEIFHYYQKKWSSHTAMKEIYKPPIPALGDEASLARKWAADIKGVGAEISEIVARRFKSPLAVANMDEEDWAAVPGVSVSMAKRIVKQVRGWL